MSEVIYDVMIVGAGAAGLAAARELSRRGCSVVILEARNRPGGRIFTLHEPSSTVPIELGAEFIHGRSPELFEIVAAAGLRVEEVTSHHWFYEKGRLTTSREFWSKLEKLMEGMNLDEPDKTFREYLEEVPRDDDEESAKELARRFVEGFHAARLEQIGVHGLVKDRDEADKIEGDRSFRLPDGYDGVIKFLLKEAESYGARCLLNTSVTRVTWKLGEVSARCDTSTGESQVRARKAVVTLPVSLLAAQDGPPALEFVPSLPANVLQALLNIRMGDVVRIVLNFKSRFWKSLKLAGSDLIDDMAELGFLHYPAAAFPTWWTLLPEVAPVLVGWAGGPSATNLPVDHKELTSLALSSLATVFAISEKEIADQLVQSFIHDWRHDPRLRGGYTYLPVGGLDAQVTLARPVGDTIFFAGEATAVGHIGTVHGAIESGYRAAKQILQVSD